MAGVDEIGQLVEGPRVACLEPFAVAMIGDERRHRLNPHHGVGRRCASAGRKRMAQHAEHVGPGVEDANRHRAAIAADAHAVEWVGFERPDNGVVLVIFQRGAEDDALPAAPVQHLDRETASQ